MNFGLAVSVILLLAYGARIVGAFLHDEDRQVDPNRKPRTTTREVVDAFAWPITMFQSKAKRGMELSALRVLVITVEYFVIAKLDWTGEWNMWKVMALLGPPLLLILEPLFAMIPIRELSLAAAAYFGTQIAKRVKKTEETVEVPLATPPDNPTPPEDPDAGVTSGG